ncbi:hypothetical protein Q3G72_028753 [Acer saccharum]|nr:hypothetical protein Q3G72_028753 [Acer saccharum]
MGYYSKLVSIEETEFNHEEDEEEEKPYSKIKLRYINMIKAEKLKSILVARIQMARIHLWLVRVTSMAMLWAIALQLRALGNTLAPTPNFPALPPPRFYHNNGYLLVSSNGGLNQMRSGICDMVTIARFLNVTLIVPQLDNTSFWNDYSQFSDIFDVDYFINSLRDEVRILKDLPLALKRKVEAEKLYSMPPISWSNMTYYYDVILPRFRTFGVVHFQKTDARLANNGIPEEVQKLRCRVNYQALRFAPAIEELAKKIVRILREKGPFLVLHLRYEMDMIAFSGCNEGCDNQEVDDLTKMRYAYPWWKEKEIDGVAKRKAGLCPLTPEETALILTALGIDHNMQVYIAAGDIYGGEKRLSTLRLAYPNLVKKETLLPPEDLRPFQNHSNQMAALDYYVAVQSDIFVPTNGGNMAKVVEGHRRYLGYKRSVILDRKVVVELIDAYKYGKISWDEFVRSVKETHEDRWGGPIKRLKVAGEEYQGFILSCSQDHFILHSSETRDSLPNVAKRRKDLPHYPSAKRQGAISISNYTSQALRPFLPRFILHAKRDGDFAMQN